MDVTLINVVWISSMWDAIEVYLLCTEWLRKIPKTEVSTRPWLLLITCTRRQNAAIAATNWERSVVVHCHLIIGIVCLLYIYPNTHTHTHIYIYIYGGDNDCNNGRNLHVVMPFPLRRLPLWLSLPIEMYLHRLCTLVALLTVTVCQIVNVTKRGSKSECRSRGLQHGLGRTFCSGIRYRGA